MAAAGLKAMARTRTVKLGRFRMSLGIPGEFGNPKFTGAIDTVACRPWLSWNRTTCSGRASRSMSTWT
jgi:hypothetical protein